MEMEKEITEEEFQKRMKDIVAEKIKTIKILVEAISDEEISIENFSIVTSIQENSKLLFGNFCAYIGYLGRKKGQEKMKFGLQKNSWLPIIIPVDPFESENENKNNKNVLSR